jgi:hypothetical protein
LHVIPYRERFQNLIVLSLGKNTCGVGLPLDGADSAPPEELASENASTSARE